ncbi:carboxyl- PDZ ligand of neuronal nitric oxide synthase protein [Trichinella spiralis]|uniref:carboxyl- PDZ ligand of neuronal nitric oxide synthase protein n=1 Tax=Trichinella spiralis TaxID=6334 RepID=UPI0001EFC7D8|nr:carboxyl- PDZ ligand of neuronal nitric oxide synthase protein [Trichinella spiralis]
MYAHSFATGVLEHSISSASSPPRKVVLLTSLNCTNLLHAALFLFILSYANCTCYTDQHYIGSMEMFRPATRIEIVAAMRRVRYEFKARGISKKKVDLIISIDGIKVIMRKRKKKHRGVWDESECLVMFHPIYRVFYVSHDSQDLQIFSYIARDGSNNTFKCNVFKCSKKNKGILHLRLISQASINR